MVMAVYRYPQEVHDFVKKWAPKLRDDDLAEKCNRELGTSFTAQSMKSFRGNHGYRNGKKQWSSEEYWKYQKVYPQGMYEFVRDNSWGVSSKTYEELIRTAAANGAISMTTEFFCLERRSVNIARENYRELSNIIGHDIVDFYARNSKGQGYLRLNRAIKEPYIRDMQRIAKECGIRFYVSDAHFKEASDSKCCCGIDDSWNLSGANFAQALQICKKNGIVTFSEIMEDSDFLNFPWGRAEFYNCGSAENRAKYDGMSMKDYLRYTWNHPNRGQSPYTYFEGVMKPVGTDEHGDVIYVYDSSRTYVGGGDAETKMQ